MTSKKPYRLAVSPKWQSKAFVPGKGWESAGAGRIDSHGARAGVILKGASYATLFAYLWRRFGPPASGCDGHKDLTVYWITTPLDGVGIGLTCSPSFPPCGVFYAISPKWVRKIEEWESGDSFRWLRGFGSHCLCDNFWLLNDISSFAAGHVQYSAIPKASPAFQRQVLRLAREYTERVGPRPRIRHVRAGNYDTPFPLEDLPASPHRTILAAIEATLRDLLRPVAIRDQFINACGPVDDASVRRSVRCSSRSGFGCSPDFIDAGKDWFTLAEEIRAVGVSEALRRLRGAGEMIAKTAPGFRMLSAAEIRRVGYPNSSAAA